MISQIESMGSEALGREVTVERATFNPFSLEAKLYDVAVGAKDGEPGKLLEIGKISANPQLSSVFGTIAIKSIEVSDGSVWVAVDNSGVFSFQDILDAQASAPADDSEEPGEIPAVIVKDLLLSNLQLHYRDDSLSTPYEETVTIESFAGRDIGTVEKNSTASTDTGDRPLHWDFDGLIATASGARIGLNGGAESLSPWRFRVDTEMSGFPLQSVQPYVDESVVAQLAGVLSFKLRETIALTDSGPSVTVSGSLGIDEFSFSDSEQSFARWDALTVSGVEIDTETMKLSVAEIAYESPAFEAILLEDKSPRLPEMKVASTESEPAAESEPMNFEASLNSVVISQGRVAIEDRSVSTPFKTELDAIEMSLMELKAKQVGDGYDASGTLSLTLNVLGGMLNLDASLESLEGLADASLKLVGVQINNLQPYVAQYANAELEEGEFSLEFQASAQALSDPKLNGSFGLKGLKVREIGTEKQLAAITSLDVEGIQFSEGSVRIDLVSLDEPTVAAWQDDYGINLARIAKFEAEIEQQTENIEKETGMLFNLGRLELKSAGVGFVDTTLVSTHNSKVSDFDLVVEDISTDSEGLSNFEFSGVIDGSARIAGNGAFSVADPSKHLDLDMSFRGYDLTATSPYWATYLGRKLSKGQFEIISKYEVRDNQLKGTNDFKIDQLTLGEKVESERAINLPLGFAIKLMQDPSGLISYNGLPVEGDLSDPQVKPWGLIGKAFRNLILKAVASPLKFLAGLAGGREDLDTISFAVAEVELSSESLEKVDALRKFMIERPGLRMEVGFLPNPAEETYLVEQYTKHRLANPDLQIISGLDLLKPVDEEALKTVVRSRYAELMAASVATDAEGSTTEVTDEVAGTAVTVEKRTDDREERVGLVKRLASLVGLGSKDESTTSEDGKATKAPSSEEGEESSGDPSLPDSDLPSYETMLSAVLESTPKTSFDNNWVEDLEGERIRNFKSALLDSGEIEGNRVFSAEINEAEAKGSLGSIQVSLAE
ncbi:DUF748 domain-containing protein [Pelagicoccus sp. SDUM812002]|nr:DUF748 domain-containing protein [Pelagicoccus sp. SDUM812002]